MTDKIIAYKAKLCEALEACMAEPVSSRSVSNCVMLMDALCKLDDDHFRGHTKMMEFTKEDAEHWTAKMENEDGTTGPHWTMGQTDAVANITGVSVKSCVWWAAMNMMYSDYYSVAAKYGLDRPEFYADLAKAFLMDKDAGGAEEKMAGYYHGIVLRGK